MDQEIVFFNGKFLDIDKANISILDRGFMYGDGLFETMRSYNGHVFMLDLHLNRFFKSSREIFLDLPYNQEQLTKIICEVIKKNKFSEAIIKLTATRGVSKPGLGLDTHSSPTLLVNARQLKPLPKDFYENGVKISLHPSSAIKLSGLSTQIKSCNYLSHIIIKKLADDQGAFEGIMLNEQGHVCAGTTSNIFIVKKEVLLTPPISEYVLAGVTRAVILDIAKNMGINSKEEYFTKNDIESADEIFLTNTGIEILPVCKVDNSTLNLAVPGRLTNSLYDRFLKLIDEVSK
jgi:branched-chain amino acid aminotransferase